MKTLCSKPSETSHFTQNEVQKLGPAKLHIIFMIPPPPPVLPTSFSTIFFLLRQSHPGFFAVPLTHSSYSGLRAFARAVPSAWHVLSPDSCSAHSLSSLPNIISNTQVSLTTLLTPLVFPPNLFVT